MTTTINADTVTGGAIVTADASGVLGLQAAGNTVLTLNSSRAVGVGASPSYGTSGQVLTSAGSAAAPTWTTLGASGLTFISSQTVSTAVASVDFTSGISSTYDDYLIVVSAAACSAAGQFRFRLRQSGAFGTTYATAGSYWGNGAVGSSLMQTNTDYIGVNFSTPSSSTYWNGQFYLTNANSATARVPGFTGAVIAVSNNAAGESATLQIGGTSLTAAAVTGFQLYFSTGNVTSGTIRLYGIAKS